MAFAVIETGGKQYKVAVGEKLSIEKLLVAIGDTITFDKVLLIVDGEQVTIGTPYVSGANVSAQVVDQYRDDKKIVFKYHSKTRYKKKKGHRQNLTEVTIASVK
ncbi:MAG: 50S ribosomal protein L21 [bacterium]|nr:50S ribosomal protein L21 [bacterium]